MELKILLQEFAEKNQVTGKGALSVVLVVTQHAKGKGLPLDGNKLLTPKGGQVRGLSGPKVSKVLKKHGMHRRLASEGGRTNRGSIDIMWKYVKFLNKLAEKESVDLDLIETLWIDKVKIYFASQPFFLHFDSSKSIKHIVCDLIEQAKDRQAEMPVGSTIVGTMLQHLVGAKLNLILEQPIISHGAAVADGPSRRQGDFEIDDVVIHVTTAPTEKLLMKCIDNLSQGSKPLIITLEDKIAMAQGLAQNINIFDRVDIFGAEQFIAGNIYELSCFSSAKRKITAEQLISHYNMIVDEHETEPGLNISVERE